ncbi:hypothetical protein [Streptomyces sp. NBC_01744]|uniref:hypothetical protein n=1 Tax=Streptomyces sp. NBC_01744 TaxID=2975927 RepID=UPI003D9A6224|nr:hypothetical protein OIE70_24745 [Streptomyces sp. NBC_01744]
MDAIQQHMIDSYRAAQHGELPPPLPGRHDWAVVRDVRDRRRFDAVTAAHGTTRTVHPRPPLHPAGQLHPAG